MSTVSEALDWATEQLSESDDARLDSQVLLAYALNVSRTWLFTWPDKALDGATLTAFNALIEERKSGTPIAYITGYRDFWSLRLKVTPDTLIPRADTELLVGTALTLKNVEKPCDVIDLGTGTGAIALSLANECPSWRITATDINPKTLAVAKENAQTLELAVSFKESAWFDAINDRYDLVISNPPYIESDDPHLQQGDLRFEPAGALASGQDGLDDIRRLVQQALKHLKKDGYLLLEHGYEQAEAVRSLMAKAGYIDIETHQDIEDRDRITLGKIPT
jgi:release factor glutamine methyltransferase